MTEIIFVSIIIPTYNNRDYLKENIKSLYNQTYPKDKYEIIVVDDGSIDGTGQWVELQRNKYHCNLSYFFQKNKGPASARNLGIRNSLGEIVAFIDSDCIASCTWIEEIIKGYDDNRVAGVGGRIKALPTASKISQYCVYIKMNEQPLINKTGIVYLITGNASFKKNCLNNVGGFDERYNFAGGEDPDLCYRLKRQGYIFRYNRDAVVYNHHKEKMGEFFKTYFNYGKGDEFLLSRRLSHRDLISVSGWRWPFFFLKTVGIMMLKCLNYLNLAFKFFKIPFKALLYYSEGFNMRESFLYAYLDYVKIFSFVQGHFFGYTIGKFKGFKNAG